MNPKKQLNHELYIQSLRRLTPEQRVMKACEMAELGRELFMLGLRRRNAELTEEELQELARKRLALCHNRIY